MPTKSFDTSIHVFQGQYTMPIYFGCHLLTTREGMASMEIIIFLVIQGIKNISNVSLLYNISYKVYSRYIYLQFIDLTNYFTFKSLIRTTLNLFLMTDIP